MRRKRPELWKDNLWFLHHASATAHESLLIRDFCAKNNTTVLPPIRSPNLVPADFLLFPKLKSPLKGQRFATKEEIRENSQAELCVILKTAFQGYFQQWKSCWERCINQRKSTSKETSLDKIQVTPKKCKNQSSVII